MYACLLSSSCIRCQSMLYFLLYMLLLFSLYISICDGQYQCTALYLISKYKCIRKKVCASWTCMMSICCIHYYVFIEYICMYFILEWRLLLGVMHHFYLNQTLSIFAVPWIFQKSTALNCMGYDNLPFQPMWSALCLAALMAAFSHAFISPWSDDSKCAWEDMWIFGTNCTSDLFWEL